MLAGDCQKTGSYRVKPGGIHARILPDPVPDSRARDPAGHSFRYKIEIF
jgi:hypothetical protein